MVVTSGPLEYRPEMRKIVTSSPTVTLMVTRIPSTVTEEGLENIFLGFNVLNMRLVINKGGFPGVRGFYAHVTVAAPPPIFYSSPCRTCALVNPCCKPTLMDNIYSVGVRSYYCGVMAAVWDLPAELAAN